MNPPSVGQPAAQAPGRVVVLLSAYNGSKFIVEQIRSILEQLPPDGLLMVRDDGSKDNTCDLVEHLGDHRIALIRGANIGFSQSFLTLLSLAPADAELVMFSDQDDVWMPDKVARAWDWICNQGDRPALYGSTQQLVDAQLRPMNVTRRWRTPISFASAVCENRITGCTAALNAPALNLVKAAGVPRDVLFHDWWLFVLVTAFGTVWIDPKPTLLYRQHGSNQIGHGAGWWGRHRHIIRFLLREDWVGILLLQVQALHRTLGYRLTHDQQALLANCFCRSARGLVPRWRLILGPGRWREDILHEATFRLLLAFHRLGIWPPPSRRLHSDTEPRDV